MSDEFEDSAVTMDFYEVVDTTSNSRVDTTISVTKGQFGHVMVDVDEEVYKSGSAAVRNLKTGIVEYQFFEGVSTSSPGNILALAKYDGKLISEHNLTTGETKSVRTLDSFVMNPIFGGFAFSFINAVTAPLMLLYVAALSVRRWKSSQISNLFLEEKINPWPDLIKIERLMAVIQLVVLSCVTYTWFFGELTIDNTTAGAVLGTFWGFSALWAASTTLIFAATISRKIFDRKIAIKLRKTADEVIALSRKGR